MKKRQKSYGCDRLMGNGHCIECNREFDLSNEDDANEFYYGHDCEVST